MRVVLPANKNRFQSIQYLRAFAALIVIFHHALRPRPWLYNPISQYGAGQAGVDIFFVISGFIMYSAARKEGVGQFAWRRFVRIAPLYWLATLVTFIILESRLHFQPVGPNMLDLLQSILFIPHYNRIVPDQVWPYLVPGWTLNFEAFFYLIFAIGLVTKKLVPTVLILLVALIIAGVLFPSRSAIWLTYTNPLLAEFLGGLLIARFQDQIVRPLTIFLLPLGILGLAVSAFVPAPRVLIWGLPALAIVIGALSLERSGHLPDWRFAAALGDGSYSIYLFQVIGIGVATAIVQHLPLHGVPQLACMIVGALACAIALGMAAHYLVERPLTRYLTRRRSAARLDVLAAP